MFDANSAAGLIWATMMGLALGNLATNPVFRLPRGEPLFERTPYCGDCNAELKPKDLFPVFSWLSTAGKCRYCGAGIPPTYFWIELLVTLVFAGLYLAYGFGEDMMLRGLAVTALTMMAVMEHDDRFFSYRTLIAAAVCGMLLRTAVEGTVFGFAISAMVGIAVGVMCLLVYRWWTGSKPQGGRYPHIVVMLGVAGIWCKPILLGVMLIMFALAVLVARATGQKDRPRTVLCFAIALSVCLLWPGMEGAAIKMLVGG